MDEFAKMVSILSGPGRGDGLDAFERMLERCRLGIEDLSALNSTSSWGQLAIECHRVSGSLPGGEALYGLVTNLRMFADAHQAPGATLGPEGVARVQSLVQVLTQERERGVLALQGLRQALATREA